MKRPAPSSVGRGEERFSGSSSRTLDQELVLLAARIASVPGVQRQLTRLVADAGVSPERVAEISARHGVTALVLRSLRRLPGTSEADSRRFLDLLRPAARSQALAAARMADELVRLIAMLSASGVPTLPYKGPALAQDVYGDVTLRQCRDLDLLVPEGLRKQAIARLEDDGYRLVVEQRTREERRGREYELGFFHDRRGVRLEVHWALQPSPWPLDLTVAGMLQHSREVPLPAGSIRGPGREDLLLALAVHGAKHSFHHLLWICDVAETSRAASAGDGLDWNSLLARATRLRCRRMLVLAMLLAHDLLDAELPAAIARAATTDPLARELAEGFSASLFDPAPALSGPPLYFALRERFSSRLRYGAYRLTSLARVSVSPTEKDRRFLPMPRRLRAAHFLVRPIRAAVDGGWHVLREIGSEAGELLGTFAPGRTARRARRRR
jgi:hypothetical protein